MTQCRVQPDKRFLWILALGLAAAAVFFMETRVFNYDAIETIHSAWKITTGEKIYVDFDQPHHPGVYFLLAPIIMLLGERLETLFGIHYFIICLSLGVLSLTYVLGRLLFDRWTAITAVLILGALPWFAMSAFVIRADIPMLLFEMAALYFLYRFFKTPRNHFLILSAISISIAFIFLQKAVFFALFMGVLMLKALWRRELSLKQLGLYLVTGMAVQGLFWLFMAQMSSLSDYFFFNFTFVMERQEDLRDPVKWAMIANMLGNWQAMAPLLVIGLLAALIREGRNAHVLELGCGALWLLSTVFLVGRPYEQYYLPAMPLAALVLAASLCRLRTPNLYKSLLAGIVLFGCLNYVIWGVTEVEKRRYFVEKIAYVLETIPQDEPIYDYSNQFNLFRKDLDFFWYGGDAYTDIKRHQTYQRLRPYSYDIYALIDGMRPKMISHYSIDTTVRPWILWRYRQNRRFEDIYELIPNRTGYDYWTTFTDTLDTGSWITFATLHPLPFTKEGMLEIEMGLGTPKGSEYPFTGLDMRFTFDRAVVDHSGADGVTLTYRLEGPADLLLSQQGMPPGQEYRISLPPSSNYTTRTFPWSAFQQPAWVAEQREMATSKLTGLKLTATAPEETVRLGIGPVAFGQ